MQLAEAATADFGFDLPEKLSEKAVIAPIVRNEMMLEEVAANG